MTNKIIKLINNTVTSEEDEIKHYRERIFNIITLSFLITGFFALILGIAASIKYNVLPIAIIDIIAYIFLIYIYLNKSIDLDIRKSVLIFMALALGICFLLVLGPKSPGFIYILAFNLLTALLLGTRKVIYSLLTTTIIILIISSLIHINFLPKLPIHEYQTFEFLAVGINLLLVGSISALPLAFLVNKLEKYIFEQKKLQEQLENNLAELSVAKQKAEESDKLKSTFLANVSHEIRTPLNSILGFSELLLEQQTIKSEKEYKFIKNINDSGKYLLKIIVNILDISMIESKQMKYYIHEVNLNRVFEELQNIFYPTIKQSKSVNFKFINNFEQDDIIINTDGARLKQVFINLIRNAIKFTQQGEIAIGYEIESEYIKFYVKDTGKGISKENKSLIFDLFVKGQENELENLDGTGLGLAISRGIVNVLGGNIWVDSTVGRGSTFFFTIPLVQGKIKNKAI